MSERLRLRYECGIPELPSSRSISLAHKDGTLRVGRIRIPCGQIHSADVIPATEAKGGTIKRAVVGTVLLGPIGGIIGGMSARDARKTFALMIEYEDADCGIYKAGFTGHVRDLPAARKLVNAVVQSRAIAERRKSDKNFKPAGSFGHRLWRTFYVVSLWLLVAIVLSVLVAAIIG